MTSASQAAPAPDADEFEADLAKLSLGPQLAAPHAEDFAGVAQAKWPGASREPRGRDARDLRREVAAQGHHAVRGRVHQAEGLVGEPGAGAAQHAVLEFDERRLDPLVALRGEAGEQLFGERGLGARLGRQQVAQAGRQQGRCLGFRHGGDTLQPRGERRNGSGPGVGGQDKDDRLTLRRCLPIVRRRGAPVAQVVEHLTFNQRVPGSSPGGRTNRIKGLGAVRGAARTRSPPASWR